MKDNWRKTNGKWRNTNSKSKKTKKQKNLKQIITHWLISWTQFDIVIRCTVLCAFFSHASHPSRGRKPGASQPESPWGFEGEREPQIQTQGHASNEQRLSSIWAKYESRGYTWIHRHTHKWLCPECQEGGEQNIRCLNWHWSPRVALLLLLLASLRHCVPINATNITISNT